MIYNVLQCKTSTAHTQQHLSNVINSYFHLQANKLRINYSWRVWEIKTTDREERAVVSDKRTGESLSLSLFWTNGMTLPPL